MTCPCCGDPMPTRLVVCWSCWRSTDRVTAGAYVLASTGERVTITAADWVRWSLARAVRMGRLAL